MTARKKAVPVKPVNEGGESRDGWRFGTDSDCHHTQEVEVSEHQPHPRVGVIYQFNHAMARVISFDDKIVRWKEVVIGPNNRRQPRLKRTTNETPRWYFDQHSSVTLQHLVRRKP